MKRKTCHYRASIRHLKTALMILRAYRVYSAEADQLDRGAGKNVQATNLRVYIQSVLSVANCTNSDNFKNEILISGEINKRT